jgi:hypothetical protein
MSSRGTGIQGGGVFVPFEAGLDGLKDGVTQAKRIVGDAARRLGKDG